MKSVILLWKVTVCTVGIIHNTFPYGNGSEHGSVYHLTPRGCLVMLGYSFGCHTMMPLASSEQRPEMVLNILKYTGRFRLLQTKCLCLSKTLILKPNAQCGGIRRWDLCEVLRSWGWSLKGYILPGSFSPPTALLRSNKQINCIYLK